MKINDILIENILSNLLILAKEELNISQLPTIDLIDTASSINNSSFGVFDGNTIKVISKDRHPMDVMRTVAHELVHWKQQLENKDLNGADGSETENEANAIAGIIMRKLGKKFPSYFIDSIPNNFSENILPISHRNVKQIPEPKVKKVAPTQKIEPEKDVIKHKTSSGSSKIDTWA